MPAPISDRAEFGRITAKADESSKIPLIAKGAGSQTGNLAEFQDATGTVRASIDSAGGLTIGAGAKIVKHLSAAASLDFGALAAHSCKDLPVSVEGAAVGDTVALGLPSSLASTAGLQFTGFVSAPSAVTVRACNVQTRTSANAATAAVRVDVWQH